MAWKCHSQQKTAVYHCVSSLLRRPDQHTVTFSVCLGDSKFQLRCFWSYHPLLWLGLFISIQLSATPLHRALLSWCVYPTPTAFQSAARKKAYPMTLHKNISQHPTFRQAIPLHTVEQKESGATLHIQLSGFNQKNFDHTLMHSVHFAFRASSCDSNTICVRLCVCACPPCVSPAAFSPSTVWQV